MKITIEQGNISPLANLDENGFPSLLSTDEDSHEEVDVRAPLPAGDCRSSTSDFALDFYFSGANWSHLIREEGDDNTDNEKKNLVQRDLFQAWGIKNQSKRPGVIIPSITSKRRRSINGDIASANVSINEREGDSNVSDQIRSCPFYKKIPGTSFTVDAFRYGSIDGCSAYFLSHFHYDHYVGLNKRWSHGKIYCTDLTARLLTMSLSVNPLYIIPLALNSEHAIEDVKVTLMEANHCPGAALILFLLKDGRRFLHTGDFRASEAMQHYPLLTNLHINLLYLDTTYCNPKYRFPPKEVIAFVVRTCIKYISEQPKGLVVVGAYSIGKEAVYLAISQALGVPIYTNASRRKILQSFCWPELSGKLCSSAESSPLHVLPISSLNHEKLEEYLKSYKQQFRTVLAFRPTGWTYSENTASKLDLIKPAIRGRITLYGVPYSEHSSFTELKDFVKFLKPEKIIPTVNAGNAANRAMMQSYFSEWLKL